MLHFRLMNLYTKYMAKATFKSRLIAILIISSLVPFIAIGYISYYTLSSIQHSKVSSNISATLDSVRKSLESSMQDISNITKQFTYESTIGVESYSTSSIRRYIEYAKGDALFSDSEILAVSNFSLNLRKRMLLLSSSNPMIGLISFCVVDKGQTTKNSGTNGFILSNENVLGNADISQLPTIVSTDEYTYYFPHNSVAEANSSQYVVSVARKVDVTDIDNLYVYIETNPKWLGNLLDMKQYGMKTYHFIEDSSGRVIYNENPKMVNLEDLQKYYLLFESKSKDGWKITAAILKTDYNREVNKWLGMFLLLGCMVVVFSCALALLMWRTLYRPIRALGMEIKLMSDYKSEPHIRVTRVKEFDELLVEFYEMRKYIRGLIEQIRNKEKQQKELEIEKLLVQINPHFIYNTLNSMQWMARINQQKDLEKMASKFSQVLGYNLGKKSIIVSLMDEIEALENYIELQKLRYQNQFEVDVEVDPSLLDLEIPRFILQPIVENAIYHGMRENDTEIAIVVKPIADEHFRITIRDNGVGMTPEEVRKLTREDTSQDRKNGLGIGLMYVDRMIKFYYGEQYNIQIESEKGNGTAIILELPYKLKEDVK